ncbi:short-chain dehydrogenase [Bradyrhizobium canariense]|uniref:Short-chain dehydrogenase n=1 Tax=Bradyrhizobium canariense TaxID=255045 RepID=A0ABX3X358_9BRAD|nr:SDR family oxidoreductase [Bradyrhizobium canariense]OSJ13576.1 short-chain dehydrogenase [Bradyrhizobium canariense]OSJ28791.1 short-chain dehydrogenase [Bradyrhizobium canariense]
MAKFGSESHQQQSHPHGWSLEGRVALVTGATGGLGKAIVAELSERGADVHSVDMAGDGVFHADLATANGNRDMIAHVIKAAGRLDVLVLNAGVQFMAPFDQFPDAEWDRLNALMLDGPFHALKAAWPALTKVPGGRVVVTASVASYGGARQKVAYSAAKHGVLGVVRTAALEGGAHGLTVNAVAPGWMDTPLMRGQLEAQAKNRGMSTEEVVAAFRASQPGNRFVDVREVAATIGFLASPSASGISGECITIDLAASA